jgi:hypothetical protein
MNQKELNKIIKDTKVGIHNLTIEEKGTYLFEIPGELDILGAKITTHGGFIRIKAPKSKVGDKKFLDRVRSVFRDEGFRDQYCLGIFKKDENGEFIKIFDAKNSKEFTKNK